MQVRLFHNEPFQLLAEDDVASMFEKLSVVGTDLLIETLPAIFAGTITEQ